jgi:hypothetical protein
MRNVKWLVAAGLVVAVTGCVETNGYPTTSYGGYPSYGGGYPSYGGGYPSSYDTSGYGYGYSQPSYYQPAPVVTQTRYVPVPVASPPQVVTRTQYVPVPTPTTPTPRHRDRDSDRRDSDKNGDGIPDRLQRNR